MKMDNRAVDSFAQDDLVWEIPAERKHPEGTVGRVVKVEVDATSRDGEAGRITGGDVRVTVEWPGKPYAPMKGSASHFMHAKLHPLSRMYYEALAIHGDKSEEIEDRARDLAIAIIVTGGFDCMDSDMLGDEMGDTVQTALMLAFVRQPEMMEHHEEAHMIGPDWKHKDEHPID